MPAESQKTVTLSKSDVAIIEPIAEKQMRSVSSIVRLCILAQFGNKQEQKDALEILGGMK